MAQQKSEDASLNPSETSSGVSSASLYSTLALTCILPVGLKLTQDSLRALFADFDVDVSQLTLLFLNRSMPFALLVLPFCVVAARFAIDNPRVRDHCYVVFATLSIISLVFAGLAFGVPLANQVRGLQG